MRRDGMYVVYLLSLVFQLVGNALHPSPLFKLEEFFLHSFSPPLEL